MRITSKNLNTCKDAFLHDALYVIITRYPLFESCYIDPNGGLALSFSRELTSWEIKDVLSQFINGDIERDKMEIEFYKDFEIDFESSRTQVFPEYVYSV